MIVLGVAFFFRHISTFYRAIFDRIFKNQSKSIVVLSFNLKRYFAYDLFFQNYGGLKMAVFTNMGQVTREI